MGSCHGYAPSWAHERDRVPNMRLKPAGLWMFGLFLACSERAERRENVPRSALNSAGTYCFQEPGTLRVSEDSVGPLDVRLSLQRLKAVCPAARDTVDSETNAIYPSVVFPFKGLTFVGGISRCAWSRHQWRRFPRWEKRHRDVLQTPARVPGL